MVSFVFTANMVASDAGTVTISGLGFLASDLTVTAAIGGASCATSAWSSATSVACVAAVGAMTGVAKTVAVTASSVAGTRSGGFSFDGTHWQFCMKTRL